MRIEIRGLEQLQKKLDAETFNRQMRGLTRAVAAEVQDKIAPYPAATAGNRPAGPRSRWYERGYGPRWMRVDGSIGGSKTSETLGRRWGFRQSGTTGTILGNIASYAGWVHSAKDQAEAHKRHGWMTDKKAIDQVVRSGVIDRMVNTILARMGW